MYRFERIGTDEKESIKELFISVFTDDPWNDDWSDDRQLDLYISDLIAQDISLTYTHNSSCSFNLNCSDFPNSCCLIVCLHIRVIVFLTLKLYQIDPRLFICILYKLIRKTTF